MTFFDVAIKSTKFDVIIDKMAVLVWGLWRLWHTVFEMNVVCIFLHMEPRDNKGKK